MQTPFSRRSFLRHAAVGAAVGLSAHTLDITDAEARKRPQIYGVGRIGTNIEGVTIPSPSDFGFTADLEGGQFVCSMFGSATGGFKGCNIMTVEGTVTENTLQIFRGTASFGIKVSIFAQPDVFTNSGPILSIGPLPGTIKVKLGGPGKATMQMTIPDVTPAVGGDTGGIVQYGRIEKRRIRA